MFIFWVLFVCLKRKIRIFSFAFSYFVYFVFVILVEFKDFFYNKIIDYVIFCLNFIFIFNLIKFFQLIKLIKKISKEFKIKILFTEIIVFCKFLIRKIKIIIFIFLLLQNSFHLFSVNPSICFILI